MKEFFKSWWKGSPALFLFWFSYCVGSLDRSPIKHDYLWLFYVMLALAYYFLFTITFKLQESE